MLWQLCIGLFCSFLMLPVLCIAQDFHERLLGTAYDSSGAQVPGGKVEVNLVGSLVHRKATSNQKGEFEVINLQPGFYHVTIDAPGLARAEANTSVEVGSMREISVTLQASSLQQTVNVTSSASSITNAPVDTTSAVHGGVVTAADLNPIPLAGRSFANIAFLVPGTYNALSFHLQGNVSSRFNLVVNYTLSKSKTWGCVLGELFDYVNGVCNPLNAFAKGDYGPSGEDVTSRFVLAGTYHFWGGVDLTTLTQAEVRARLLLPRRLT